MYVTILNRSEKEFWTSTLRKVVSQINIHTDLHKGKSTGSKKADNGKIRVNNRDYEVLKAN